ncbi:MAG: YggS family pyridoxal phosphate-dependent enzyme [Candidatus Latescibacteria bacterium]|nr:YggS family pyridoxal phosphate-dependent enzyme [Candidatus Latescibacterota bacterium]
MTSISENLKRVRERIARAAERAGRQARDVTLVAVSKTVPAKAIGEAVEAGVRVLGENRVQEAETKVDNVNHAVEWHLVGHLQRNKVKSALRMFEMIHSVDSLRLATEIGKRAVQAGVSARTLVQVNTSGADSQFGAAPDEAVDLVGRISEVEGVGVEGLMTIGLFLPDPEAVRPCFVQLRELREEIAAARIPGVSMAHLSMGMTGDFEVAIEEGATMVRVGSAVFGSRQ